MTTNVTSPILEGTPTSPISQSARYTGESVQVKSTVDAKSPVYIHISVLYLRTSVVHDKSKFAKITVHQMAQLGSKYELLQ